LVGQNHSIKSPTNFEAASFNQIVSGTPHRYTPYTISSVRHAKIWSCKNVEGVSITLFNDNDWGKNSLTHVQIEVESFTKRGTTTNEKTLWEKLIDSSRKIDGAGCEGILMREVEKYTEEFLSRIDKKGLYEIWQETENGIMSIRQGFDDPEKCEMIHDIGIDVYEQIVESICLEARKRLRRKNNRKTSERI